MLERWTELLGYYCISKRGPRIFIRDLLPTLDRASFLSDLPSLCLLLLLLRRRRRFLKLVKTLLTLLRSYPGCQALGKKEETLHAPFPLLGKARCPALVPLLAPCPMPACRMPSGAAR